MNNNLASYSASFPPPHTLLVAKVTSLSLTWPYAAVTQISGARSSNHWRNSASLADSGHLIKLPSPSSLCCSAYVEIGECTNVFLFRPRRLGGWDTTPTSSIWPLWFAALSASKTGMAQAGVPRKTTLGGWWWWCTNWELYFPCSSDLVVSVELLATVLLQTSNRGGWGWGWGWAGFELRKYHRNGIVGKLVTCWLLQIVRVLHILLACDNDGYSPTKYNWSVCYVTIDSARPFFSPPPRELNSVNWSVSQICASKKHC